MKKTKKIALSLMLGFASLGQNSFADIISFDDLPATEIADTIANGYQGFDWSMFGYVHKYALPNTGFEKGVVSGEYAAYNEFAATATTGGNSFDFNGAYLTAAWNDGLNIEVTGSLGGTTKYIKTVFTNTKQSQWFDFNFWEIDALSFRAFGGTRNPDLDSDGEFFILDNFTYNEPRPPVAEAAEPSTMVLFGLGIVLLGLMNNRRKKV